MVLAEIVLGRRGGKGGDRAHGSGVADGASGQREEVGEVCCGGKGRQIVVPATLCGLRHTRRRNAMRTRAIRRNLPRS